MRSGSYIMPGLREAGQALRPFSPCGGEPQEAPPWAHFIPVGIGVVLGLLLIVDYVG